MATFNLESTENYAHEIYSHDQAFGMHLSISHLRSLFIRGGAERIMWLGDDTESPGHIKKSLVLMIVISHRDDPKPRDV